MKKRNCGNCFRPQSDKFDGTCGKHGEISTNYCCKDHKYASSKMKIILHYIHSGIKEEYDTSEKLLEVLGNRIEDGSYQEKGPIDIYKICKKCGYIDRENSKICKKCEF